MKYFKIESTRQQILCDGKTIQFMPVFGGEGVLSLEDSEQSKIDCLTALAQARIQGVVIISPEIFESLKKNEAVLTTSRRPSRLNQMRVSPSESSATLAVPRVAVPVDKGITVMPEPGPPATIRNFTPRGRPIA